MSTNGFPDLSYKPKRPPVAALPCDVFIPLDANEDVSYGQIALIDPSTGYAQLADASTPHMIAGGTANLSESSASSTVAGTARLAVSWGCAVGRPGSTTANDSPSLTSIGKAAWVAGASTYGLLSHTGTVAGANLADRSLGGLFLGLDPDSPVNGTARPYVWEGPVAQAVARGVLLADKAIGGSVAKAVDAGAATDLSETLLDNISPLHGKVSAVRFIVSGTTLSASGTTDYKTLKLWKRPASGGTAVLVASADTQTTAWTQWETVTFTLSAVAGAIDKLETDIYTITETHGGSGAIIPAGKLIVDLEVR
jgi:hypothetical protein